jgi:hypothetical protein
MLFTSTIPTTGAATAKRWATVGSRLLSHFQALRPTTIDNATRNTALADLRSAAETALREAGVSEPILAWALPGEDDEHHPDWL